LNTGNEWDGARNLFPNLFWKKEAENQATKKKPKRRVKISSALFLLVAALFRFFFTQHQSPFKNENRSCFKVFSEI